VNAVSPAVIATPILDLFPKKPSMTWCRKSRGAARGTTDGEVAALVISGPVRRQFHHGTMPTISAAARAIIEDGETGRRNGERRSTSAFFGLDHFVFRGILWFFGFRFRISDSRFRGFSWQEDFSRSNLIYLSSL